VFFASNLLGAYILFCKNTFLHQQNVTNAFGAAVFFAQQKTKAVQKCIFAKQRKCFARIASLF